ncbi:Fc.00g116370.m01.CDS01 [Cosmosporella sp. VM-42]
MSDSRDMSSPVRRTAVVSGKRSSMACTTCRQVKLRCDATKRFPAPCSRCERQGKACLFNPVFKRKAIRGALEKAIEERDELRRLVDVKTDDASSQEKETQFDLGMARKLRSPQGHQIRSVVQKASVPSASPQKGVEFDLDGVHLDDATVRELLDHFCEHYLYHLPILDIRGPANSLLNTSPILFWTIIIITARDHPTYTILEAQLQHPYQKLLSQHVLSSICCVYTIQALLLLCIWPFPVRHQDDDPSWGYSGLAVAATLQMRLHETGVGKSDDKPELADIVALRLKTWLGCFFVSTRLSADLGLSPPMASVAHMETRILRQVQDQLPKDFLDELELQRYSVRVAAVLSNSSSYSLQTTFVDLLEHDLGAVEDNMRPLALTTEVDLLAAKLRLYALPLLTSKTYRLTNQEHASSRVAWYKGLHVAVQLANIFTDSSRDQGPRCSASLRIHDPCEPLTTTFHPKHYFCVLVMTGMYLLKLVAVDDEISARDKTLACTWIKRVHTTLIRWSQHDRDEKDRAAKMIEIISDHADDRSFAQRDLEQQVDTIPSIIDDGKETARLIRQLRFSAWGGKESRNAQVFSAPATSETMGTDPAMTFSLDDFSEWNPWFGTDEMTSLLQTSSNFP